MGYNILIVDDSNTVRSVLAKTLNLAGVPVSTLKEAENGEQALEVLKSQWIDLVITDLNMPVMNGFSLIERMSADDVLVSIPVIVVTTEGSTQRIEKLKNFDIKGYVRKPFTPEQIKSVVEQAMGEV